MNWMEYRPACGCLADSMLNRYTLPATLESLAAYLGVAKEDIEVRPYVYDERIGWNTHLVTVKDNVVGFTNKPLTPR